MIYNIMTFVNSDSLWIGVIIIGSIVYFSLKMTTPKPKPKPTTVDVLSDIRSEIGFLSDEVRGIKNKIK